MSALKKSDGRAEPALIGVTGLLRERRQFEHDPLEVDMMHGAALALRKRAERQAKIAEAGKTLGDRGVVIMTGAAVLADRLSTVLAELAAELEGAQR
jgi:hypothetical protein